MLKQIGFKPMQSNSIVYIHKDMDDKIKIIASIHVDDFLIIIRIKATYQLFKMQVNQLIDYEMLGKTDLFLGIQIKRSDNDSYTLSQQLYLDAILDKFQYSDIRKIDMLMDAGIYKLVYSI
jgi:reverse transcriptase-like protein